MEHLFEKGSIIVSTNLAGRGTNIATGRKVDDNGGLHVCITFLPLSERVEDQGKGRTSRQGNRGTAQMILNREDMSQEYYGLFAINEIKEKRRNLEKERLDHFEEYELKEITRKDRMFQEFWKFYKQLKEYCKQPSREANGETQKDLAILEIENHHKILAVEEKWGLFLKHLDFSKEEAVVESFVKFQCQIKEEFIKD